VARLALLDGLRQSEVAERLGVRRATISVSFGRARIQSLAGLVAAIRRVYGSEDSNRNSIRATEAVAPAGDSLALATAT
jgi:predicted DNA-binding protein (UPF0251 family)